MGGAPARPSWPFRALALAYDATLAALIPLAAMAARWSAKARRFHAGRRLDAATLARLADARARHRRAWVHFVSSAGEYEQALPLVARLEAAGDAFQLIVFFSESGIAYARARGETRPYLKAPYDRLSQWRRLLAAVRPQAAFVVRHELWPGFLGAMAAHGPVHVIDATDSHEGRAPGPLTRFVKANLLRMTASIALADESDRPYFAALCGDAGPRLRVTGDTKWDRVIERAAAGGGAGAPAWLADAGETRLRFVVGSAWPDDAEAVARAWAAHRDAFAGRWQLLVAPHDLSPAMVARIAGTLEAHGLTVARHGALAGDAAGARAADAVVVDAMGMLAEIYGAAHAALVGGAFHHKVHNVLEPAVRGLFIAVGPRYKNSREAIQLVADGHVTAVNDAAGLAAWWRDIDGRAAGRNQALLAAVRAHAGAADRILAALGDPQRESP